MLAAKVLAQQLNRKTSILQGVATLIRNYYSKGIPTSQIHQPIFLSIKLVFQPMKNCAEFVSFRIDK